MAQDGIVKSEGGPSDIMPPRLSETSYDDEDDLVRAAVLCSSTDFLKHDNSSTCTNDLVGLNCSQQHYVPWSCSAVYYRIYLPYLVL